MSVPRITKRHIDGLGKPTFFTELSYEAILAAMKADLIARWPDYNVGSLESDPAVKLLEVAAYDKMITVQQVNEAVRSVLLAFAKTTDLDHVGAFYDVPRLTGEDDDRFFNRIILGIQGRSTGGTRERYEFIAMSASSNVAEAYAYVAKDDPRINVSILSVTNDGVASASLLDIVRDELDARDARMMNDTIVVSRAVKSAVDIKANIWLLPGTSRAVFDGLEQKLRDAWAEEVTIGLDLNRSWITSRLMADGVQNVVIESPGADVLVAFSEAVRIGDVTLTFMGRSE